MATANISPVTSSHTVIDSITFHGWGLVGGDATKDIGDGLPITVGGIEITGNYSVINNRTFQLRGNYTSGPFFPTNLTWVDNAENFPLLNSTIVTLANGWTVAYLSTDNVTSWMKPGGAYADTIDYNPVVTVIEGGITTDITESITSGITASIT